MTNLEFTRRFQTLKETLITIRIEGVFKPGQLCADRTPLACELFAHLYCTDSVAWGYFFSHSSLVRRSPCVVKKSVIFAFSSETISMHSQPAREAIQRTVNCHTLPCLQGVMVTKFVNQNKVVRKFDSYFISVFGLKLLVLSTDLPG